MTIVMMQMTLRVFKIHLAGMGQRVVYLYVCLDFLYCVFVFAILFTRNWDSSRIQRVLSSSFPATQTPTWTNRGLFTLFFLLLIILFIIVIILIITINLVIIIITAISSSSKSRIVPFEN